MSDSNGPVTSESGNFWQGFLISLAAWILDVGLATLIYGWVLFDRNRGWRSFWGQVMGPFSPMIIPLAIVLAMIWLPVAVIAGFRSRNKGFKASQRLVLWVLIIAPIIIGCSASIIGGLAG